MQKDVTYHRSAIQYNDALAVIAEEQAELVEHPEVKKWCRSVGRQHRFHSKRHRSALAKLEKSTSESDEQNDDNIEAQVTTLVPTDVAVEVATLEPAQIEVDIDLSGEKES
jgi:hypothetical protein